MFNRVFFNASVGYFDGTDFTQESQLSDFGFDKQVVNAVCVN